MACATDGAHTCTVNTHVQVVRAINTVLYDQLGFKGNADAYYEADNSCINRVLDRKTGGLRTYMQTCMQACSCIRQAGTQRAWEHGVLVASSVQRSHREAAHKGR